ncbi:MAG: hypothetical protein NVV59_02555 [Chitinophagaceae bacterium]|nr:hypothetical protein [Chitinophagaceae bacterium]
MTLQEVNTAATRKLFLDINVIINGNDPNYIQPLDKDIQLVFDPKLNKAFRHGEATRWVLIDKNGKGIGRIAAFVNKKYKTKNDHGPIGGIGFFDCIHNQEAADMLFDVAKHWLMQRGMVSMDGPINFGERDRWWGLLVEGFEPPLYCMNYNPPYYQQLFETYGFRNYFNQICFALKVKDRLQQKFFDRHAECAKNPDLRADHIRKDQLDKFARDFTIVYNKAWAGHGGMKTLEEKVVRKMFASMKPVMDEKVCWFVYDKEEPIALWVNLPDLNQWFKHLHGKFSLFHKLKFLWVKKTKPCTRFVGLVFGVVPEWQGKGIDSYMIVEGCREIQSMDVTNGKYEVGKILYEDYEMQWIGEFNPKMINVAEALGTYRSRKLTTYRYNFDRSIPFQPHPIL